MNEWHVYLCEFFFGTGGGGLAGETTGVTSSSLLSIGTMTINNVASSNAVVWFSFMVVVRIVGTVIK